MNAMPWSSLRRIATSGLFVVVAGVALAQQPVDPQAVDRAGGGAAGLWDLRSEHLVWGMPRQTDGRHNVRFPGETQARPGLSVLVREGFVIGHYDLHKVPAWVAVRWDREDHDRLVSGSYGRSFTMDDELPRYARAQTSYDYATSDMERGHMARHEDNEAWGEDCSDAGCRMSNVVPQHKDMNGEAWNDLEELTQEVVADTDLDIEIVWVISGPIFEDHDGDGDDDPASTVANGVGVPQATYKIVGWFDGDGMFNARGYVVRQEDRIRDPAHYLRSIDEIEAATGLDFFPELPAERAQQIESVMPTTLWGPVDEDGGEVGGGVARIVSFLPNPIDNESLTEAVTIANEGGGAVNLAGWRLRDESGRHWVLFGVLQSGDERRFEREGQPMALNNNGDTIELLDEHDAVVDSVTYTSAPEGETLLASQFR